MPTRIDMAKFAKFCKDMGFIFQSTEIYGGINGFWDYGPLGVELKKNIKEAWWQDMVRNPPPGPGRPGDPHGRPRLLDHHEPEGVGGERARRRVSATRWWTARPRAARAGSAPTRSPTTPCPLKPSKCAGPVREVSAHRAARLQPDVQDHAGAIESEDEHGLPPPRNRPGHLRQLQERARQHAAQAAVRHRPGRQGVPQRDQPAELHLPLARVRADGDRVLLPPGRVDEVVRVLARPAQELVHARSASSRDNLQAARAGQGGTRPLLDRHHRHRVHVPVLRRAAGAGGRRPPRRLRPDAAHEAQRQGPRLLRRGRAGTRDAAGRTHQLVQGVAEDEPADGGRSRSTSSSPHVIEPSAGADRFTLAVLCEAYTEDKVPDEKGEHARADRHEVPPAAGADQGRDLPAGQQGRHAGEGEGALPRAEAALQRRSTTTAARSAAATAGRTRPARRSASPSTARR